MAAKASYSGSPRWPSTFFRRTGRERCSVAAAGRAGGRSCPPAAGSVPAVANPWPSPAVVQGHCPGRSPGKVLWPTNAGAIQVSPWEGAQPHTPRLLMPVTVRRCWWPSPPEHPELSARASSRRNCNRMMRALAVPARRILAASTEAESVAGSGSGPPGGRPRASPLGSP